MRIDAHQHFWRISRGDYSWLTPKLGKIHRDFEPRDLEPILAKHGIAKTVLVQAADTVSETRFLLELASQHSFIAGVVGWIDFDLSHAVTTLESLAHDPKLLGVRPMIQDITDVDWMLHTAHAPVYQALTAKGLRFDALVLPKHLKNLLTLLHRHPELRAVVDHGGKPEIRSRALDPWRTDIARIAKETTACCKLSGLVTEANPDWTPADLHPYMDHLLECFGPQRLMFGSDWPVLELAGDYSRWYEVMSDYVSTLSTSESDAILGDTAARFYGIR